MTGVCAQSDAAIKDEYACSILPVRGPCKGARAGGCLDVFAPPREDFLAGGTSSFIREPCSGSRGNSGGDDQDDAAPLDLFAPKADKQTDVSRCPLCAKADCGTSANYWASVLDAPLPRMAFHLSSDRRPPSS